jgi:4-hydroxyphenylpyruvate dioxygenase-like putative hemolysin
MIEELPFSKVDQIGIVVRDMDKAIEHYQSLGIGLFEPLKLEIAERVMWGKPVTPDSMKNKVSLAQMGSVQYELIEPVFGNSLWREFLETRGEGIHHLGFFVTDIDKEIAKLEKKGFKIIWRMRFKDGGGSVYFDTDRVGGIILEFIQWPPE